MRKQIDPNATQEYGIYPDTPLNRVHQSLSSVRKCPVCQGRIDILHAQAFTEDINRDSNTGFELK